MEEESLHWEASSAATGHRRRHACTGRRRLLPAAATVEVPWERGSRRRRGTRNAAVPVNPGGIGQPPYGAQQPERARACARTGCGEEMAESCLPTPPPPPTLPTAQTHDPRVPPTRTCTPSTPTRWRRPRSCIIRLRLGSKAERGQGSRLWLWASGGWPIPPGFTRTTQSPPTPLLITYNKSDTHPEHRDSQLIQPLTARQCFDSESRADGGTRSSPPCTAQPSQHREGGRQGGSPSLAEREGGGQARKASGFLYPPQHGCSRNHRLPPDRSNAGQILVKRCPPQFPQP